MTRAAAAWFAKAGAAGKSQCIYAYLYMSVFIYAPERFAKRVRLGNHNVFIHIYFCLCSYMHLSGLQRGGLGNHNLALRAAAVPSIHL